MSNRKRNGHKVTAGAALREFHDSSRDSLRVLPTNEAGWLAIRRPSSTVQYTNLEFTDFCVVTELSTNYSTVAYWFKNLNTTARGYVGAIVIFKGYLSLNTTHTVIYILRDGTLLHDMRNRDWAVDKIVDMPTKIENEYNLAMNPNTIERHKKVLIKLEDHDEDQIVFASATGSRLIGRIDRGTYYTTDDNGVKVDDEGVPLDRTRKTITEVTVTKPKKEEPVSLEPWKEFLKNMAPETLINSTVDVEMESEEQEASTDNDTDPNVKTVDGLQEIVDTLLVNIEKLNSEIVRLENNVGALEACKRNDGILIKRLTDRNIQLTEGLKKVRSILNP